MAATTAAIAMSSAARQLSRSASTIFMREVSGSHKLTIDGYSASKKIGQGRLGTSQPFEAAGHTWRIKYLPSGRKGDGDDDGISLYLELAHGGGHGDNHHDFHVQHNHPIPIQFKFSLLDLAGNPVPGYTRSRKECVFWRHPTTPGASVGFHDFVKWKDLHESGALKDDRFAIRCDITAITDWSEPDSVDSDDSNDDGAPVSTIGVPPSNLHQQLSDLLWKQKHGADVTIDVAGQTFEAHGWLLAARSPVFQALLTSSKKEKKEPPSGAAARRTIIMINGIMEPKACKAMLHFMYTDALPQDVQDGDGGHAVQMARGLLVAAHRYKLERLKLMCEETLCRRIDVDTVAAILVAAEEHRCQALKVSCAAFMARPGCLKAVMETRGFEEMKATCLPLLLEILVKQLA